MHAALISIWLAFEALAGSAYDSGVKRLSDPQPEPAYIGLTAEEARDRLGEPTRRRFGVWTYWRLHAGYNTVVPVTILRFREGRVVATVRGFEMVGCIIAVPRRGPTAPSP